MRQPRDRAQRPRRAYRGRPSRRGQPRQPVREGALGGTGAVPSGPHPLSAYPHHAEGAGPQVAPRQPRRGHQVYGRRPEQRHREVRPTRHQNAARHGPHHHVRHRGVSHLPAANGEHRQPRRCHLQGPAPVRGGHDLLPGRALVQPHRRPEGQLPVGHEPGSVELRQLLPRHRRRAREGRDHHLRRPAYAEPRQGSRHLA